MHQVLCSLGEKVFILVLGINKQPSHKSQEVGQVRG